MQLSKHDLKQLDEKFVRSLATDKLQILSLKLLGDLREAHDRLNQNPENSSRPPSSRAPWEGRDDAEGDDTDNGAPVSEKERESAAETDEQDDTGQLQAGAADQAQ
jgi:hypothetical protein